MRVRIDGNPVPYANAKVTRRGTYSPRYYEKKIVTAQLASLGFEKLTGPLRATLIFGMPIPESTSKKRRADMLARKIYPTTKPDVDNLVKFILDCGKKILYPDDNLIVQLVVSEYYDEAPYTILHVENVLPLNH